VITFVEARLGEPSAKTTLTIVEKLGAGFDADR
jgi:hypothetical protein